MPRPFVDEFENILSAAYFLILSSLAVAKSY